MFLKKETSMIHTPSVNSAGGAAQGPQKPDNQSNKLHKDYGQGMLAAFGFVGTSEQGKVLSTGRDERSGS